MVNKELGKIIKVNFGYGGYQDAMLGISLTFSLRRSGTTVCEFLGVWSEYNNIREMSETEKAQRGKECRNLITSIDQLLSDSQKTNILDLVGVPVECTFNGSALTDWRVLTEVL